MSSAKPLTSGGKPEVLYIGAQYCPYCATERWALAVALSRFGTFHGLSGIHSASGQEVYPHTATLNFYKASYTSKYLTFTPVEQETVAEKPLEKLTSAQTALITKYDSPPYVAASDTGAIPFIDFGGKYFVHGAQYNPQVLSGQTWAQVAAALKDPSSAIAKGADGSANMITATICKITNNQPSNVCTSPTDQVPAGPALMAAPRQAAGTGARKNKGPAAGGPSPRPVTAQARRGGTRPGAARRPADQAANPAAQSRPSAAASGQQPPPPRRPSRRSRSRRSGSSWSPGRWPSPAWASRPT